MNIKSLLDQVRSHYLTRFSEAVAETAKNSGRVMIEAAFHNENGDLVGEGVLGLSLRRDMFLVIDGKAPDSIRIETEEMFSFEPIMVELSSSLTTRFAPFRWESCDLYVTGLSVSTDWSHLKKWFAKWFDTGDTCQAGEKVFLALFISFPIRHSKIRRQIFRLILVQRQLGHLWNYLKPCEFQARH
jgi:hypothetical protein